MVQSPTRGAVTAGCGAAGAGAAGVWEHARVSTEAATIRGKKLDHRVEFIGTIIP